MKTEEPPTPTPGDLGCPMAGAAGGVRQRQVHPVAVQIVDGHFAACHGNRALWSSKSWGGVALEPRARS